MADDDFIPFGSGAKGAKFDKTLASAQFAAHVRNIANTYDEARNGDPRVFKGGQEWYERARDIADRLGGGDTVKGAGVIAAMSPQTGWKQNVDLASSMFKSGDAPTTGQRVESARRIMDGEHPLDVMKGHKTRAFFSNIIDPDDPHPVTIDRHAYDIAVGERNGSADRKLSSAPRYQHFADAYRAATDLTDESVPSRIQAVTWSHWRGSAD